MNVDVETRIAAGEALREWRTERDLTLRQVCDRLQDKLGKSRVANQGIVSRWERGDAVPSAAFLDALKLIGAPIDGWKGAQKPPKEDPAAHVQEMLERGESLADVYAAAAKLLAASVSRGLTPDKARGWETLMRMLRAGAAERGKIMPLEQHPDWSRVIELILDAVAALPGGAQAVLGAVRAASGVTEAAA